VEKTFFSKPQLWILYASEEKGKTFPLSNGAKTNIIFWPPLVTFFQGLEDEEGKGHHRPDRLTGYFPIAQGEKGNGK
jgi:hypothetical protein